MTITKERNIYERVKKEDVYKKLIGIFGDENVTNKEVISIHILMI